MTGSRRRRRGGSLGLHPGVPWLMSLLVALLLWSPWEVDAFATPPSPGGSGGGSGNKGKGRAPPPWRRRGGGGGKRKKQDGREEGKQQQQQAPRMKPKLMPATQAQSAREAAYLAALGAERDQMFIADALQDWARVKRPSSSEMGLATLVASVACREAASLDYAIRELAGGGPLKLKARQRVVLRVALAQVKYCTRMPLYAIVDHAVDLAKRYGGGAPFASFVNAVLRKLPPDADDGVVEGPTRPLPCPTGKSVEALSASLSYPPFLVRRFVEDFGPATARGVMEAGNTFPPTMVRSRGRDVRAPAIAVATDDDDDDGDEEQAPAVATTRSLFEPVAAGDLPPALAAASAAPLPYTLGVLRSEGLLRKLANDTAWYITNGTPAGLIARLAEGAVGRILGPGATEPLRVLDLCAAPGGKGLAVWDVVRGAQGHPVAIVMNDVSEDKTRRISENLAKFGLGPPEVRISIGDGSRVTLDDLGEHGQGFDVVVVDAPCSNAGVLGRRPEARWRLADDRLLTELEATQLSLIANAKALLSTAHPGAEIWYMTCSVLACEDEGMVAKACAELGLEVVDPKLQMKVLPGEGGLGGAFDGGFAVALRRREEHEGGQP